jgi:hypothetical protein
MRPSSRQHDPPRSLGRVMKLHHAAALALVGWYLMVPPPAYKDGKPLVGVNLDAPLSEWTISRAFDSAAACEAQRADDVTRLSRIMLKGAPPDAFASVASSKTVKWAVGYGLATERCIATDDPRLK